MAVTIRSSLSHPVATRCHVHDELASPSGREAASAVIGGHCNEHHPTAGHPGSRPARRHPVQPGSGAAGPADRTDRARPELLRHPQVRPGPGQPAGDGAQPPRAAHRRALRDVRRPVEEARSAAQVARGDAHREPDRMQLVPGLRLLRGPFARRRPRQDRRGGQLADSRDLHRRGAARSGIRRGDDGDAARGHRRDDAGTADRYRGRWPGGTDHDRRGGESAIQVQLRARPCVPRIFRVVPGAEPPVTGLADFAQHRDLLFTVAYEITASIADAEDVVQESYLRWAELDETRREQIENPRAYLARIATRQALNRLRTRSRQRDDYVGPWLPEPLITGPDVAQDVELAESVSMAMMLVVESLSPDERAVFLLHEVFGFAHDEIADAVDKSPAAVRQIAHRARAHVQARRPRFPQDEAAAQRVAARFLVAAATGDLQSLMDVLAPDVVLLNDGGGKVKAALRPVITADRVARFMIGVVSALPEVEVRAANVNGRPGILLSIDGVLDTVATFDIVGDQITALYFVRNPD